jgi:t-SNARE complex subunit (syntaxin)
MATKKRAKHHPDEREVENAYRSRGEPASALKVVRQQDIIELEKHAERIQAILRSLEEMVDEQSGGK